MTSRLRYSVFVSACVLLASSRPSSAQGRNERDALAALGPAARQQLQALVQEKQARTEAQRKISSHLLVPLKRLRGDAATARVPALQSAAAVDGKGLVLVDVRGTIGKPLVEAIEALGGTLVYGSPADGRLRARVPLAALEALAERSDVQFVRPAVGAMLRGSGPASDVHRRLQTRVRPDFAARARTVRQRLPELLARLRARTAANPQAAALGLSTTEGDAAHGAPDARHFFGVTGAGVKVGVLSDSVDFLAEVQAAGDLPPDVTVLPGQSGVPGTGEGTAMLEIVHDLAPGAQLFFATAFTSDTSFADNIRALRAAGCDVIVDDVIYFSESPFQDGVIAKAVDDVVQDGALYFSSAGNEGNFNDGTSGVWEGDFRNGGTLPQLPGGTVHDFGAGNVSNRVERAADFVAALYWSDPLGASGNDYDLIVLDAALRNIVDASTDIQDGDDDPFEIVLGPAANRRFVILNFEGAEPRALHLNTFGGELAVSTPGATHGHSAARGAVSVAAVDSFLAGGAPFTGGPTNPVELFSADGPRRIFYNADGTLIHPSAPPLFNLGGGERRPKPDITAADGSSLTTPGFNPFFGTSASAAHAAGIGALLKAAVPTARQARIKRAITETALDIEAPGRDRDSGAGIMMAFEALEHLGAAPAPFIDLGPVAVTPTAGDGDAILEPGDSARLVLPLVNNGGATAIRVRATLTTSTPGVTITSATSAYPNIGSNGASAPNTTPFAFGIAGSIPCGTVLRFRLVVTFTGRSSPRVLDFTLPTGTASSATTRIEYAGSPAPIPDNAPAGVSVPIVVSGFTGGIADLDFVIGGSACSNVAGSTTAGLDHTWVGDLAITLTSPRGTTVKLLDRPGGALNGGNNFCQTVLDDSASASIQAITAAGAPYTGTFRPAAALSAFAGEDPNGTWTVTVSDRALADVGNVRNVGLVLSQFDCP